MSQLLKVEQVAEILGMRVSTIRAWIAKRKLPCVHCGRAVRIPAETVDEFILANTVPAREAVK